MNVAIYGTTVNQDWRLTPKGGLWNQKKQNVKQEGYSFATLLVRIRSSKAYSFRKAFLAAKGGIYLVMPSFRFRSGTILVLCTVLSAG